MDSIIDATAGSRQEQLLLRAEIDDFNAAYAAALDEGRLQDWPGFFTDEAFYLITSRENHDAGLPVGLVYCEGAGMLRDRAFAIEKTAMFAPRYLRHIVGTSRLLSGGEDGTVAATANYLVLQTLFDRPESTIHQVGTYIDRFRRVDGVLKLQERRCVYDNLLVPNALVYPV
jgi:Small subunit of phenylpropionate dioxygenase